MDEVLKLRLEGALTYDDVGALAGIIRPTEEAYRLRLLAVGDYHRAAAVDLDRVVERAGIAPLPLDVGDGAAPEAQRHQGVVQAVVLTTKDTPGVDPLDLAQSPTQK